MRRVLDGDQIPVIRDDTHHTVAIDITDSGSKGKVFDSLIILNSLITLTREEHHSLAKLEGMLNLLVGGAYHLHGKLVERVIITLLHLQGPPRITTLDFPLHPHLLRLFAESLLLRLVLQLEQQPLLF